MGVDQNRTESQNVDHDETVNRKHDGDQIFPDVVTHSTQLDGNYTIGADEGVVAVGPLTGSGTITGSGKLAVLNEGSQYTDDVDAQGNDLNNLNKLTTDGIDVSDAKVVSPQTHDFDDILSDMRSGKTVIATPGEYPSNDSSPSAVRDGALYCLDGAVIVPPSSAGTNWLEIGGEKLGSDETDITSDVSVRDVIIDVADSSGFKSGQLALIVDDETLHAGASGMNTGEAVMIDKVIDSTTVRIRGGAALSHSTSNNISIYPVDHWDGFVRGGTWDLRNLDQNNNGWPVIRCRRTVGAEFRDITLKYDGATSVHQFISLSDGWNPLLADIETGRANTGDLQLFAQLGNRTKYAEMRDCTIHGGRVTEYENDGAGPCVWPQHNNVTYTGLADGTSTTAFSINDTVIGAEFDGCTVINVGSGGAAFSNAGRDTVIRDSTVKSRGDSDLANAVRMTGVGGVIKDMDVENIQTVVLVGGDIGGHPNAGSETVEVIGVTAENVNRLINGSAGDTSIPDLEIRDCWTDGTINTSEPVESIEITNVKFSDAPIRTLPNYLYLSDCEYDGKGSGDWIRGGGSNVNEVHVEGGSAYNAGSSSAIRISEANTVIVNGLTVPQGKTAIGNYLVRAEADVTTLRITGCDGRNTGLDGYRAETAVDAVKNSTSLGSTTGGGF